LVNQHSNVAVLSVVAIRIQIITDKFLFTHLSIL
jgi:hypothetical protein